MTITIVIINPQTGNGVGVWMTPCPEEMVLRIWRFWKRVSSNWTMEAYSWDWIFEVRVGYSAIESWDCPLKDLVGIFGSLPTRILNITRYTARCEWGQHSENCISLVMSPWTRTRNKIHRSYLKRQSPCIWIVCLYMYCNTVVICIVLLFVYVLYYCYHYGYVIQQWPKDGTRTCTNIHV